MYTSKKHCYSFFVFLSETESDVLVHVGELGTYMLVRKGDGSTSSTMIFTFSSLTPPTSSSEHSWWMVWNFVPRQNQTSKVGIGRCTNSGRSKLWDWQVCYMYRPGRDSSENVIRSYSCRNYVVTKNTGTFSPDWWLIDSRFIYWHVQLLGECKMRVPRAPATTNVLSQPTTCATTIALLSGTKHHRLEY